jgi:hypothetical protein
MYLTLKTCENISLRVVDSLIFPTTRMALEQSISRFNVATLDELMQISNHDFGIYLSLEPDEEEKQVLEQNIQIALKAGQIELDDVIDIRQVHNLKLANQILKSRKKRKAERDQAQQQQMIQAQAQANAESAEKAALAETQKQQVLTEQKVQFEKMKSEFDTLKMEKEAQIKLQLMQKEFEFNMQLAQVNAQGKKGAEAYKEDRKDKRSQMEASQQSELINQRKNNSLPTNFESAGNDTMEGFGLEQFMPR